MGKLFEKFAIVTLSIGLASGCSSIVEPVKLADLSPDPSLQEEFRIELEPLTFKAAQQLNSEKYQRFVSRPGNAFSANVVAENSIGILKFPETSATHEYFLGVGDELQFIQNTEGGLPLSPINNFTSTQTDPGGNDALLSTVTPTSNTLSQVISTKGRIGNDGSVLLMGVGRIQAEGYKISQLRDAVRSILIQNGKTPDFQLEIFAFNSQRAYITTDKGINTEEGVVKITDQGITLSQLIASAGLAFDEKFMTIIKIRREGKTYSLRLSDVFSDDADEIYLKDKDHVFVQNLEYVPGKVFLIGGVTPIIIPIKPEQRQSLAEVLFTREGPLEVKTAQRSAVYLLRGTKPLKAYHLDAQNPARILVADAVELRPNDIVYVAEQPISTFNRVLETILPLRVFSRDTRDGNLP